MAAYRTAARHCPGLHAPLLGMGMEYGRMHNTPLAEHMFAAARGLCPRDPGVHHELGVLAYRWGGRGWKGGAACCIKGHAGVCWWTRRGGATSWGGACCLLAAWVVRA